MEDERSRLLRSIPGDLRDVDLDANAGEGERRIRGGDGVYGVRFLCGDRDLRLLRGDLLRDLQNVDYYLKFLCIYCIY